MIFKICYVRLYYDSGTDCVLRIRKEFNKNDHKINISSKQCCFSTSFV
jgi:hypothetical protein